MSVKAEILNELMEISPALAGLERVNPYTVPVGYFEGLGASILTLVKEDEEPSLLQGLATKNPMQAPEGYFDNLAGSILDKIKAKQNVTVDDELRDLSPMLYTMDKANVYEVPTGYFETLSNELLNKVSPKEEAKIISFTQRKSITWMRYAAAAVVIGLVGMIALFIFRNGTITSIDSVVKLDSVVKKGVDLANQNKFDEELNKTSDDAIANYLDKTADEADAIQMVASVDQNQLPSEEELMSNEKLMDDLLNEIDNKKTSN